MQAVLRETGSEREALQTNLKLVELEKVVMILEWMSFDVPWNVWKIMETFIFPVYF